MPPASRRAFSRRTPVLVSWVDLRWNRSRATTRIYGEVPSLSNRSSRLPDANRRPLSYHPPQNAPLFSQRERRGAAAFCDSSEVSWERSALITSKSNTFGYCVGRRACLTVVLSQRGRYAAPGCPAHQHFS